MQAADRDQPATSRGGTRSLRSPTVAAAKPIWTWSRDQAPRAPSVSRFPPAVHTVTYPREQVDLSLAAAKRTGWAGSRQAQHEYLDHLWERADIQLEGDPALQQAVRFALFHVVQAAVRAEQRAIPAKG
jgi:hypothetical protein